MSTPTPTAPDQTVEAPQGMRASDADRHTVERLLQNALGAGMLTLDETEERMAAVRAARYRGELAPLTADLAVDELDGQAGDPGGWWARARGTALLWMAAMVALWRGASTRQRVAVGSALVVAVLLVGFVLTTGLEMAFSGEEFEGPGRR